MCSNIPASPAYGVYISQLIRYARASVLTFTFTEYRTVLTTILPILFLYLNTVIVTAGAFKP